MGTELMESTISNHSRRWDLLPLLCLATLSILLSINIVLTALIHISEAFPKMHNIAEWTLLSYSLIAASLSILAGDLGDRYGLRRLFGIGLQFFIIGSLLAAFSPTGSWLVGSRIVAGMGSAIIAPVSLAFVNRLFPLTERPLAFGYWSASVSIGTVIGPILGGWIQEIWSWRMVFPIASIPACIALIFLRSLPEYYPAERPNRPDTLGLLALTILPFLLLFNLAELSRMPAYINLIIATFTALLGAFTLRHLRISKNPVIPLQLLSQKEWWLPSSLQLTTRCIFMASLTLMTLYLQTICNLSALDASFHLIPFCLSVGIMSFMSGRLCKILGTKRLLNIAYAIGSTGLLLLLPIGVDGFSRLNWLGIVAIGVMVGNTAQLSRLSMSCFPKHETMVGASLNTLIINLGLSIGTVLQITVSTIASSRLSKITGWPLIGQSKQLIPPQSQLKSLADGSASIFNNWLSSMKIIVTNSLHWEIFMLAILATLSFLLTYQLIIGGQNHSSEHLPLHQ